jgi:hypothetical protein
MDKLNLPDYNPWPKPLSNWPKPSSNPRKQTVTVHAARYAFYGSSITMCGRRWRGRGYGKGLQYRLARNKSEITCTMCRMLV